MLRLRPSLIAALILVGAPAHAEETWILIDTRDLTLSVMQGEDRVKEYPAISIGRSGATAHKIYRDLKTPTGSFRIIRINNDSRYHRFFGINYPDLPYAQRAFEAGVIDEAQFSAIREAHEQGLEPPASTPLGGYIGIHGLGDGDLRVHQDYNWTEGCVALTNEEVDELSQWIRPGMVVLIL